MFINVLLLCNDVFQILWFYVIIYSSLINVSILWTLIGFFLYWSFFLFEVQEPQDNLLSIFYTYFFLEINESWFSRFWVFCLFYIWVNFVVFKFVQFLNFICLVLTNYILDHFCLSSSLLYLFFYHFYLTYFKSNSIFCTTLSNWTWNSIASLIFS